MLERVKEVKEDEVSEKISHFVFFVKSGEKKREREIMKDRNLFCFIHCTIFLKFSNKHQFRRTMERC